MAVGQTDEVALAEARRLAAAGAYDRAIAAYQRAFRGGAPPFDLAVEYYETLAGTGGGWEEARLRLKELSERSFATSRVKFAYARVLTYNEQTRREGIALLANLASDPAVGQPAFEGDAARPCCGFPSGRRIARSSNHISSVFPATRSCVTS